MGNQWFQFKQFKIYQEKNAMKVATDSCLFGALLPSYTPSNGLKMLDIGTGTGLLTLMMAQKNPNAQITALEINAEFAEEARTNFSNAPFSSQISLFVTDVFDFLPVEPFHHIVCNPPFYENQLNSPNSGKNLAHHSSQFNLENLLGWIKPMLHESGTGSILLPCYREKELMEYLTTHELVPTMIIRIQQTPKHDYFRSIIHFVHNYPNATLVEQTITIRNLNNEYSKIFTRLLKPFYLHF
jgi:tRNA1Val (adenine37-N6)-methyltransferase